MTDQNENVPKSETIAAAHGVASDPAFGTVAPPIYLSSTYEFVGYDNSRAYDYGRSGNPTRDMLADSFAKLKGGAGTIITSNGMASSDLLVGWLRSSDLAFAPHDWYGDTIGS